MIAGARDRFASVRARAFVAASRLAGSLVRHRYVLAAAVVLSAALLVVVAEARPGGGNTYRGGGSRSGGSYRGGGSSGRGGSGGGGGDIGDLFVLGYYLVRFLVEVPALGIPVLVVVGVFVLLRTREGFGRGWESSHAARPPESPTHSARKRVEALRQTDPEFSMVLFEDFLNALYTELHVANGAGKLDRLAPYVGEGARAELSKLAQGTVSAVVVGSMKLLSATSAPGASGVQPQLAVVTEFEANYSVRSADGAERAYYVRDRLTVRRSVAARSRPPEKTRTFECPSCGAPLDKMQGRTCGYCRKAVDTGEFDWVVTGFTSLDRDPRPPQLTGDAPEVGTSDPTRVAPDAVTRWEALMARDPAVTWPGFVQRLRLAFKELQAGWTARDPARVRPFMTDPLLQTWAYWFEAYARQGLRNVTENAEVTDVQLARVTSDAHFDAVTVRVFARSLDYTLDAAGKVVGGNRSKPRAYTEYWTLVRGSARKGAPRVEPVCPNCGAPLSVEATGQCTYCRAKVTSGEFDWVLSRIEQDEAYDA